MTKRSMLALLLLGSIGVLLPALADDRNGDDAKRRWWRGEGKEEFWDGPCEVKLESKRGEFKREVKCKDGVVQAGRNVSTTLRHELRGV